MAIGSLYVGCDRQSSKACDQGSDNGDKNQKSLPPSAFFK